MNESKGPVHEMSQSFEVFPHSCFVSSFCADEDLITLAGCLLSACSVSLKHSPSLTPRPPATTSPFIFSQCQIHTWTRLKPGEYHSGEGSLNWSPWDEIAAFVSNTNGRQMPLTSPSVQRGLWWQPVRITSHTRQLSNLSGVSSGCILQRKVSQHG